ncbi:hypothetical protein [Streptomyces sp. SYP-A7185]|uniref:hypothetical protein n=1 Tax=Streptomyces sp. SYP-A7185 TaxID=3040076 RepID=UPI0038F78B9D
MSLGLRPRRAPATDPADTGARDTAAPQAPPTRRRARRTLLVLVLAALLATGGGLLVLADRTAHTSGAANQALSDGERTRRVIADVSDALSAIFTYTPDDLPTTERRARAVLRGEAAKDYRALLGRLRRHVSKQDVSLTTQVVRAGAVELNGDRARLLVFLDQRAKRKGAKATTAAAQLSIAARREHGRWTITDITAR